VTYVFGFTGRSQLDDSFRSAGLQPDVVFTAADADVIKTYVRLGLGIGIVAHMAHNPQTDTDLVALPADHLFDSSVTSIGCRKGTFIRGFMYDFIELFAPHLTRDRVRNAMNSPNKEQLERLFAGLVLPRL
jgi:LysR family cys regulon transcriptional activator